MPTKHASPLLGYNNNVRHKGKVFHIQTEDSGVKYGHIITHLFMDGGRILKSVKTSYAEYAGNDRMAEIVREMMKQQHKAMFIALRDGKFDALAEGAMEAQPGAAPTAVDTNSSQANTGAAASSKVVAAEPTANDPPTVDGPEVPNTLRQSPEELMLDIGALERAAAAAAAANTPSALLRGANDLPPPPANLFRDKKATGKYKVTPPTTAGPEPRPGPAVAKPPPLPVKANAVQARRPPQAAVAASGDRRYAPTRPASIFGQARPQQGKTIFGEDLISDKSLDEVILSYLAEDLDGDGKK
jgi:hypothetical protein